VAGVIQVEDLTKQYRRARRREGFAGSLRTLISREYEEINAVNGVTFSVDRGELVGYLGPNGAGKSTTIKMMTGVLVPTSGRVQVAGVVPWRERERNAMQIGVVFGQRSQLWWDLPLIDSFRLIGKLYRMPPDRYRRNLDRLVEVLELSEFIDQPVRQLSLGQRTRGDLVASMLYEPAILYLDEPTIGLDVVARENMRTFIEQMNRESETTVVLTTHDLADVERLCRRVILIDHGVVLYDGSVDQLKARYAPHRVLVVKLAPDASGRVPEMKPEDVPEAEILDQTGDMARLRFEAVPVQQLIATVNHRYALVDLSIVEPDLEGVVGRIYRTRALVP
jgi:ABC-2 type transport system ATP-binding protein